MENKARGKREDAYEAKQQQTCRAVDCFWCKIVDDSKKALGAPQSPYGIVASTYLAHAA